MPGMSGLFGDQPRPRVFAIPIGCDFTEAFCRGLEERLGDAPPEVMARIVIHAGSQNFARELRQHLSSGPARLLPKIRHWSELIDDPAVAVAEDGPGPAMSRLGGQLQLRRLVAALLRKEPDLAPESAAIDLTESLQDVFSEIQDEGIELSQLLDIDVSGHSEHWSRSLMFLRILAETFGEDGMLDPRSQLRAAIESLVLAWQAAPPDHPVILAGSTGSTRPVARFMQVVSRLPQGAVVLPGVDPSMSAEDWALLGDHDGCPEHPQAALARFCAFAGVDPERLPPWSATVQAPANGARNRLVSLALKPAPVTDRWMADGPALVPDIGAATDGIGFIVAETAREESKAIAVAIREAVEQRKRVALITENLELARRVRSALLKWNVEPDDRIGETLHQSPGGVFLRLVLVLFAPEGLSPQRVIGLLKHPLTAAGNGRAEHLRRTLSLELELRRRPPGPEVTADSIRNWASGRVAAAQEAVRESGRSVGSDEDTNSSKSRDVAWAEWLASALEEVPGDEVRPLGMWVHEHLRVANAFASGTGRPKGPDRFDDPFRGALWETPVGKGLAEIFDELRRESDSAGSVGLLDYTAILRSQTGDRKSYLRPANQRNVMIWGGFQARDRSADLVIVASLNEGVWPRRRSGDIWLNRSMRQQIGLGPPERRNGLAAHDFQHAVSAPTVILSRALRDNETPTVASRWLIRLKNLIGGLGPEGKTALEAMTGRGQRWIALGRQIDRPSAPVPPAPRPAPRPPVEHRPTRLSVTEIRTLIRDPYAIYARHVLKLRPLDALGRGLDPRDRGTLVHRIVEDFVRSVADGTIDGHTEDFLALAARALAAEVPWPGVRRQWLTGLDRAATWFTDGEADRRIGCRTLKLEARGELGLPVALAPGFTLTTRADRIDIGEDGHLRIYDYKSGSPPSPAAIETIDKQLQLVGAIATRGGFDGVPEARVDRLEYIGFGRGGSLRAVSAEDGRLSETYGQLIQLLDAYARPEQGYPARSRMRANDPPSDYDQLSRFGEWTESDLPAGTGTES